MASATVTITLEFTVEVSGRIMRADPSTGSSEYIEDLDVESISYTTARGEVVTAPMNGARAWLAEAAIAQAEDQMNDAIWENR